ncbi:MAG: hypothetical protein EZS28_048414 [Streblomastix strix]|uniref:Uncharacterized protein n=1 Tax=Streblomastix strix TaxID=222440 RepID=A0A5J4TD37_9EUKA|nr:MAG: hypothetical protein EZS28_048414 [Streblomastix strix]
MLVKKIATDDSFTRGYNSSKIGARINIQLTPLKHYFCDAIVRVTFDVAPDPQVLTLEVIGEIGATMIRAG